MQERVSQTLVATAVVFAWGCRSHGERSPVPAPRAERSAAVSATLSAPRAEGSAAVSAPVTSSVAPVTAALPPLLPAGGWFQTFTDDAGVPTYVAVPTGATTKRPIIVGLHGAQDRPDWACSEWFGAAAGRAFVVCPRGTPLAGAWAWSSVEQIASKAEQAIALVRAHFGPWVADGRALYGGWSQAATLGALVLAKRPDLFDGGVFVELGHTPLDPRGFAGAVRQSGVAAVAVVCATGSCERWCAGAKPAISGFAFACESAGHRGHSFDGVVAARVHDAIAFVEKGDPRWAPLLAP